MDALFFDRALLTAYTIAIGVMLAVYFLLSRLTQPLEKLSTPPGLFAVNFALIGSCAFLLTFILHFGRWQFGGYDFSVLTDTGYRQILGQQPYVDFPTTTPPGFNLGIKFAFQCFGVNWNANLYALAIFCCLTFLWCYWLFIRLKLRPIAALITSFAIQSATNLTLCFWWYNTVTLVLGAIVFLAALAYATYPDERDVQASYVVSMALLALMKPNIAGIALLAAVLMALAVAGKPGKTLLLTFLAAGLSFVVLEMNHVPISALVASYQGVAKERGLGAVGLQQRDAVEKSAAFVWLVLFSIPLLRFRRSDQINTLKVLALRLYFLTALVIAIYGILTNGEFYEVECTVVIASGAVLVFANTDSSPLSRRGYMALLCGFIGSTIYLGSERIRIASVGMHRFFEANDNRNLVPAGYVNGMQVSSTLIEVERQVAQAIQDSSPPYFMGPSLEFNYAALGLPSPAHLPVWWEPGTAFRRSDTSHLIDQWRASNFRTLIFLKDDYSYYTPALGRAILDHYRRDDRYPALTIYHLQTTMALR